MTDEEKRFDRREEARLDDMYDAQYEVDTEPNDFVQGYRQGFADAKYIYDVKEKNNV